MKKTVKLPRLKMRKSTRSTLSGVLIAIASLYALASAYDEAKNNLLRFFLLSVSLLLIVALFAVSVVMIKNLIKWVYALATKKGDSQETQDE